MPPLIALTTSTQKHAEKYVQAIERRGGQVRLLTPEAHVEPGQALEGISGLLLSGGPDIHPRFYGQEIDPSAQVETPNQARDEMELGLLQEALAHDMPVLGICRGMQLLNVAFGGSLIQHIPDHQAEEDGTSAFHLVYVSPGSKLGATMGGGANYRTNSRHHQGLREPQRSAALLASSYTPEDGTIEGLESPGHSWVIGVQCHPEREEEVPRGFLNLFTVLLLRAEGFASSHTP